jgi:hypothetical protein
VDDRLFDTSAYAPATAAELATYERLADVPEAERSPTEREQLRQFGAKLVKQPLPDSRESDAASDLSPGSSADRETDQEDGRPSVE